MEVTLNGRSLTACVVLCVRACVCVRASGRGRGSTQFNERDELLRVPVNGSKLVLEGMQKGTVSLSPHTLAAKRVGWDALLLRGYCTPRLRDSRPGVGMYITLYQKKKEERGATNSRKERRGKLCRRDWVIGRWLCTSKRGPRIPKHLLCRR